MTRLNGAHSQPEPSELTTKQQRLIELLCADTSINKAAGLIGVSEGTCRRWLKLAHVDMAYRDAKHEQYKRGLTSLQQASIDALRRHIYADVEPTAASQVRAIALLFEMYRIDEVERRLDALEGRALDSQVDSL